MNYWRSLVLKGKKHGIGFRHALDGILQVMKSERNFRIHLVFIGIVMVAGIVLSLNRLEWVTILVVIGLVLTAEMCNTAIEKIIDYVKPDIHPSAKAIKDIAAGSVLIAAFISVIVGFLIFLPKLWKFF